MISTKLSSTLEKTLFISFFICIALCLIWQVIDLSRFVPLHDWDEAIYAQVAKEWMRSPSLTLHYNGLVWFEKPPLPFVIMGTLMAVSHSNIVWIRMVSAILGLGTVVCVYLIGQRLSQEKLIGLVASALYVNSTFFLDRSSIINVDMYLTLSWLLYILSERLRIRLLAVVIGVGSKSLLGFIPLLVDISYELLTRKLNLRKIIDYSIQIAIGLIWHIVMFLRFGKIFVQSHFLDHLIYRITKPIELHFGDRLFYIMKIWEDMSIWSIFAVIGFLILVVHLWKKRRQLDGYKLHYLLVSIPFLYLVLLTYGKSKLTWYTMPLIPSLTVFASVVFYTLQSRHRYLRVLSLLVIGISIIFFGAHIFSSTFHSYLIPDRTKLAQCIDRALAENKYPLAYLVVPQERGDAQVIQAANLQIGSSFIYGGAPAFIYYVNRPVTLYYSPSNLFHDWQSGKTGAFSTLVVHEEDLQDPQIAQVVARWNASTQSPSICSAGSFKAFIRDY